MRQAARVSSRLRIQGVIGVVPQRHARARIIAWLIDWCCVIAWAGVLAAVCVPLYLTGALHSLPVLAANALSAVVLVVPVTVGLAALESSRHAATIGKRVMRLSVVNNQGARIRFSRALARNGLKVAAPWLVGHAAVYAITGTSATAATPGWVWGLTGAAYVLPVVWILSLFVASGRTPYDHLTRTAVRRTPRPDTAVPADQATVALPS
ncbi:RDD family protein [Actinocatenispora sera]|uniref:RDD family protein n=1 Tax=Actinocatenispora sera TaxID=390989 RepID=UPI0033E86501